MCGIAGFWGPRGEAQQLLSIAHRMGEAIRHRGPDGWDGWSSPNDGMALHHRRLAILDLSPEGSQPMHSASGRWVLILNGEIYNYPQIRKELETNRGNHTWRGHSDTEVLVEALDTWGPEETLWKLAGMFAFAAWDCVQRRLILARDRLGEKPLYWGHLGDGTLVFSSEIRAMRVHPSWNAPIDQEALNQFLQLGYIPAPRSIFHGIQKLLPGYWAECSSPGNVAISPYWQLTDQIQEADPISEEEATTQFETLMLQIVEEQMQSDVPLGVFLSGGLDSTLIASLMQKISSRPVRSFTIGFRENGFDESPQAAQIAAHLSTEHHAWVLDGKAALEIVPTLGGIYDEPFADPSQIPTVLLSRLSREHVTVALTGDGGDELLGGYPRYNLTLQAERWTRGIPNVIRRGIARSIEWFPLERSPQTLRLLRAFTPQALWTGGGGKLTRLARILRAETPEERRLAFKSHGLPLTCGGTQLTLSPRIESLNALLNRRPIPHQIAEDVLEYLPDDLLVKVDRAAMSSSLETRAPLLDHRVVSFAWSLPDHVRFHPGMSKWLIRAILRKHVPPQLFERPKMGFSIPMATWLSGPLRPWAEELLKESSLGSTGLLNVRSVRNLWSDFLRGHISHSAQLWDILMFQNWYEHTRFNERQSS